MLRLHFSLVLDCLLISLKQRLLFVLYICFTSSTFSLLMLPLTCVMMNPVRDLRAIIILLPQTNEPYLSLLDSPPFLLPWRDVSATFVLFLRDLGMFSCRVISHRTRLIYQPGLRTPCGTCTRFSLACEGELVSRARSQDPAVRSDTIPTGKYRVGGS